MTRPLTREEARRRLHAVVKEVVPNAYGAERLTQLLDMHLARAGLCIVTIEERARLEHPTAMATGPHLHNDGPVETS